MPQDVFDSVELIDAFVAGITDMGRQVYVGAEISVDGIMMSI